MKGGILIQQLQVLAPEQPSSSGQEAPSKTLCSSLPAKRNSPQDTPKAASTRLWLILLQQQVLSEGNPALAVQAK